MAHSEREYKPSLPEKATWYGVWGGFVVAVLGTVRHLASLQLGGAGLAAGSIALRETVFKRQTSD